MHLTDNIHAMRMREGVQNLADGALNFIKNPVKVFEWVWEMCALRWRRCDSRPMRFVTGVVACVSCMTI